jgi:hypothetical protein
MQDQNNNSTESENDDTLPDEDGTVMVYGFVQIKDTQTGDILVSTRS